MSGALKVVASVDDALFHGGRALILVGSQVMLLSELSAEIVRRASVPLAVEELASQLAEIFGPPPPGIDAMGQVEGLVGDLEAAGVLRRS